MKEIVEYTDYRKYIRDYYEERKRCSVFSWQKFAQDAGFSSAVFLKYVCEGKKNLSVGSAGSVASAMGLVGFEQTYFVLMVSYAHAKDDKTKVAAFEERCALANAHKMRVLGNDEFDYFKSWKNPVLRELAPHMPGAKPLEIFAIKAIDLPLSERTMSGFVLGLTERSYERIRKEMADFYRRVVAIATEEDETERVYRMNMQLFPLSQRLESKKEKKIKKGERK